MYGEQLEYQMDEKLFLSPGLGCSKPDESNQSLARILINSIL